MHGGKQNRISGLGLWGRVLCVSLLSLSLWEEKKTTEEILGLRAVVAYVFDLSVVKVELF